MDKKQKYFSYLQILNSVNSPVVFISENGTILFFNKSAANLPLIGPELNDSSLSGLFNENNESLNTKNTLQQLANNNQWTGEAEFSNGNYSERLPVSISKHVFDEDAVLYLIDIAKQDDPETDNEYYRLLVEKQSDMIVVVDCENRFLFVSPSYCEAFGKSKEELLGNTFLPLVHNEDREKTQEAMKDLFKKPYRCNIIQRAMTKNGWRWLQWVDTAILDKDNNVTSIIGVGRDITNQIDMQGKLNEYKNNLENLVGQRTNEIMQINQRLEEEIIAKKNKESEARKSEERLKGIITSLHNCAIAVIDKNGLYLNAWADKQFEKDTGLPGDILVGKYVKDHFPPDKSEFILNIIDKVLTTGESITFEYQYPTKNEVLWHEANVSKLNGESGFKDSVVSFIQNITQRKQAELVSLEYQKQLQTLATDLTMAEERERRHIAQLLHDDIGQNLALLKVRLKMLEETITDETTKENLADIVSVLSSTIQDTRSLTFDLSPPILYELGFEEALRWLLEKYSGKLGVAGSFIRNGNSANLDDNAKGLLFHVVRELLVNISKYARSQKIALEIENTKTSVRISIEDDGIGFRPKQFDNLRDNPEGYGLFSIKERLKRFDGGMTIQSKPGKGTKVVITVPIKNEGMNSQEKQNDH